MTTGWSLQLDGNVVSDHIPPNAFQAREHNGLTRKGG